MRRLAACLLTGVCLLLLLSACGGGDGGDGNTQSNKWNEIVWNQDVWGP